MSYYMVTSQSEESGYEAPEGNLVLLITLLAEANRLLKEMPEEIDCCENVSTYG